MISFESVTKKYADGTVAADDLNFEVPDGELVVLVGPSGCDKDGLAVTQETAQEYDLETFSDLRGVADELVVGGPPEMSERPDGLPGMKEVYGI